MVHELVNGSFNDHITEYSQQYGKSKEIAKKMLEYAHQLYVYFGLAVVEKGTALTTNNVCCFDTYSLTIKTWKTLSQFFQYISGVEQDKVSARLRDVSCDVSQWLTNHLYEYVSDYKKENAPESEPQSPSTTKIFTFNLHHAGSGSSSRLSVKSIQSVFESIVDINLGNKIDIASVNGLNHLVKLLPAYA